MDPETKRFIIIIISGFIIIVFGYIAASLFLAACMVNNSPVYQSNISIDTYGAENNSLRWDYYLQPEKKYIWSKIPENWAFLSVESRSTQNFFDLSDIESISFFVKGDIENYPLEFNIFTRLPVDATGEMISYQYTSDKPVMSSTNWKKITIYLDNMVLTQWTKTSFPSASSHSDLSHVYSIGLAIKSNEIFIKNQIWIDELIFTKRDGSIEKISSFDTMNVSIKKREGIWHTGSGYLKN